MFRYFCFSLSFCLAFQVTAHPDVLSRIEQITQAIEKQPNHFALYLKRGEIHRDHQNYAAASDDYLQAKRNGAPEFIYLQHKAWLLFDQQQYASAENTLIQILGLPVTSKPDNDSMYLLHRSLAETQIKQHKWRLAAKSYDNALKVNQQLDPHLYLLAANLFLMTENNHLQAIEVLKRGIEHHPSMLCLHKKLIETESESLHLRSALNHLNKLIKQQPNLLQKSQQFSQMSCGSSLLSPSSVSGVTYE